MNEEPPGEDGFDHDGYDGSASLRHGETVVPVEVTLRGQVDTISGRYHWYGRLAADPAVTTLAETVGTRGTVVLRTPRGEAETTLGDPDPWGRYRVEGRGHAPFDVLTDVPHADA
ncbi:DUF4873 domain-containing protein [Jatrophihabitans sp. YIM 134969]